MKEPTHWLTVYKVRVPFFQKKKDETQIVAMGRYLRETVIGKYQSGQLDCLTLPTFPSWLRPPQSVLTKKSLRPTCHYKVDEVLDDRRAL